VAWSHLGVGDIHFNLNDAGIDAIHRCAQRQVCSQRPALQWS
jgi:hypothetical protein